MLTTADRLSYPREEGRPVTSWPATIRAVRLSAPALWPAASGLGAGVQVGSAAAARSRDAAERGADGEEVLLGRRCAVRVGTSLRVVGEHIGARRSGVRGCDRAGVRRGCRGHGGTEDDGEHGGGDDHPLHCGLLMLVVLVRRRSSAVAGHVAPPGVSRQVLVAETGPVS